MPNNFLPYDPPARTGLRKRLIQNQARRVELLEKQIDLTSLQLQRARLSSFERDNLVSQRSLLKDFVTKSRDVIKHVEQQDAAATRAEAALKLRPSRLRLGEPLRRSVEDRNFAILGLLQRERRQNAALTRGAYARAKAVAASRKWFASGSQSSLHGGRGYDYQVRVREVATPEVDPCVEYRRYQRRRREVMFAQGLAAVGYNTKHFRSGC